MVGDVGVDGVINRNDETREIDVELVVVANESTVLHPSVSTEGVQWYAEAGNVEDVPDADDVGAELNFDGANAGNRGAAVVGEGDKFGREWCVRCESLVVWPHMVRGTGVRNEHGWSSCRRGDGGCMRRRGRRARIIDRRR